MNFWDFAEKYDLENIAYALSIKSLNSIEPSNELSDFGSRISKAYSYNQDYINSEKWLIYATNSLNDDRSIYDLNSSKLLYSLSNIDESNNFAETLFNNLNFMNNDLIDSKIPENINKKEILNLIFSVLNKDIENPFKIERNVIDNRSMPSLYILNLIRDSSFEKNSPLLLISIITSINTIKWIELHPEHLRLVLFALKEYRDGAILNKILLEMMKQIKII